MLEGCKVLLAEMPHPVLKEMLSNKGFECDFFGDMDQNELSSRISDYNGLIIRSKLKINEELLEKAKKLTFIGRLGAGMENIDIEACSRRNITCFNSPEGNRDAVGEHALGMLLAIMNNIVQANEQVKNGQWNRESNRGIELKGKTVGIIGYGNMGSAFAEKLQGMGVQIISYDKYKKNYSPGYVIEGGLELVFSEADIVSLHVPLSTETTNMANLSFFQSFNKPVILINTARGQIVNIAHLVTAIDMGFVRGAALDVLDFEEKDFERMHSDGFSSDYNRLFADKRVLFSPHIAGWTFESEKKLSEILAHKIISEQ